MQFAYINAIRSCTIQFEFHQGGSSNNKNKTIRISDWEHVKGLKQFTPCSEIEKYYIRQHCIFTNMAEQPTAKEEKFLFTFFTAVAQCSFDKAKDLVVYLWLK